MKNNTQNLLKNTEFTETEEQKFYVLLTFRNYKVVVPFVLSLK